MSRVTLPRFRFYGSPWNYGSVIAGEIRSRRGHEKTIMRLEHEVAQFLGKSHAVALPQARLGVYLTTRALVRQGRDEVILAPYTIHDVVNMVLAGGGRPVFVDVERETCNIDPAAIPGALTDRTAFVLVTHLHGLACDMGRIEAAVAPSGVPIIEDAAQALGATHDGRRVGGIGVAGVLSFGRAKNVNAFFGGAAVSSDADLVDRMRADLAAFPPIGRAKLARRIVMCAAADVATMPPVFRGLTFPVLRAGIRSGQTGLSELVQTERDPQLRAELPEGYARQLRPSQARTVAHQLGYVDRKAAERLATARIYHEGLRGIEGLLLPPWREDGSHAYMQFPVQVADRQGLVRELALRGFDVPVQHLRNTADLPIFAPYAVDCPIARSVAESLVLLPTYPGYPVEAARALVAGIRDLMQTRIHAVH